MAKRLFGVFDIGKTTKKCFLFDEQLQPCGSVETRIPEIVDEEGFPCENLNQVADWMQSIFEGFVNWEDGTLISINVAAYGATLVHLDENNHMVFPAYNYLKPFPSHLSDLYEERHGPLDDICAQTGSPFQGMVNSGFQLFRLKHSDNELFNRVTKSVHLPQYLSSCLNGGKLYSEITSIGCHTAMWDYSQSDYHPWMVSEDLVKLLPAIAPFDHSDTVQYGDKTVRVGVGLHDSSAALYAYSKIIDEPFILLSTGTWSVALNPFTEVSPETFQAPGSLFYMQVNGKPVTAKKMLLGKEFEHQIELLTEQFKLKLYEWNRIKFDPEFRDSRLSQTFSFDWNYLETKEQNIEPVTFDTASQAYHQLLAELADIQSDMLIGLMASQTIVKTVVVEGGFAMNEVFLNLLSKKLPNIKVISANTSHGSALGALVAANPDEGLEKHLAKHYNMKTY